jgi:putative nucleotidyltransferase with HDIG domain
MGSDDGSIEVPSKNLVTGLYVDLQLSWLDHPFPFTRFRIKNESDIQLIQKLIPGKVRVYPAQSSDNIIFSDLIDDGASDDTETDTAAETNEPDPEMEAILADKKAQQERMNKLKARRIEVDREYTEKSRQIKNVTHDMKTKPANAIRDIDGLANELAEKLADKDNLLTSMVDLNTQDHTDFNHTTNVTILSLMLGSAVGLQQEDLKTLAAGALLHDIGKIETPSSILMKKTARNPSEEAVYQRHANAGSKLVGRVRAMPREVVEIIERHHEFLDGSGYPNGLTAQYLSPMVRIVTITNLYDNLCSPINIDQAMTPKNALATLYKHYANKVDTQLVERMVNTLGIYPPGTIIQLNDDQIGMVIAARPGEKLKPDILIFDPLTPKQDAVILRLGDYDDVSIERALKPGEYPEGIHEYFNLQDRIGYMVDSEIL